MDFTKTTIASEKKTRLEVAEGLLQYISNVSQGMSQRDAAEEIDIPRGTLLYWKNRKTKIPLSQSTVNFFESPDGVIFLDGKNAFCT